MSGTISRKEKVFGLMMMETAYKKLKFVSIKAMVVSKDLSSVGGMKNCIERNLWETNIAVSTARYVGVWLGGALQP